MWIIYQYSSELLHWHYPIISSVRTEGIIADMGNIDLYHRKPNKARTVCMLRGKYMQMYCMYIYMTGVGVTR